MVTRAKRSLGLFVVVVLATVQGFGALLRANQWFQAGVDLLRQGLVFIPLMGLVEIGRGGLVAGTAVLYICCSRITRRKNWAWWMGLVAALLNGLLALSLVFQGESLVHSPGLGHRAGDSTMLPFYSSQRD